MLDMSGYKIEDTHVDSDAVDDILGNDIEISSHVNGQIEQCKLFVILSLFIASHLILSNP
jgi:hypothetical protein